jgi:heat shock protein HslJ
MKHRSTRLPFLTAAILLALTTFAACTPKTISLTDSSWIVTEINGEPLLENSEITMEFTADQVAGKASCNNYFAAYTLEGDKFSIGPAGSTLMYCEGVMDQETLFLESISKADTVAIKGNQITISLNDGGSILLIEQ